MLESERLGLLGRRPNRRSTAQRYHPLVREFLEERLLRDIGSAGVDDLHVAVAEWAESTDWRTAAHHFAAAQRWPDLQRVLDTHVETIVASGAFLAAGDFVRHIQDPASSATAHVIRSRNRERRRRLFERRGICEEGGRTSPGERRSRWELGRGLYARGSVCRSRGHGRRVCPSRQVVPDARSRCRYPSRANEFRAGQPYGCGHTVRVPCRAMPGRRADALRRCQLAERGPTVSSIRAHQSLAYLRSTGDRCALNRGGGTRISGVTVRRSDSSCPARSP